MYNLTRYKQWQAFFGSLSLFFGVCFFAAGHAGINAMDPDQYGKLAVSGSIEAWATIQLSGAFLLCVGIITNGRWRWSCVARAAGAIAVCGLIFTLGYSAFTAANGWPVGMFCVGFAAWGLPVIWWNMVDTMGAIRWGRNG